MSQVYICISLLIISSGFAQSTGVEGFGSKTRGGEGNPVYHVTSLKDDGSFGTLRDALSEGNRYIMFDTAGTIVIGEDLNVGGSHVTIDGLSAPSPGITLQKSEVKIVALNIRGVSDIIIRYLRVRGLMDQQADLGLNHAGTIAISSSPSSAVRNIVIDHVTTRNAVDSGLDIWGEIRNVTIQYCLIAYSYHPQTISHYGGKEFKKRRNLSIHHNVYARNNERNPQLRADVRTIDYVNNFIYDWGYWHEEEGYGVRIKNRWEPGEPKVTMNVINNIFIATRRPDWALVYGKSPGGEENDQGPVQVLPQGSVYTRSDMDSLYVHGNILPAENKDHYSTIMDPIPIPAYAKVTLYTTDALVDSVLPFIGTHFPLDDEVNIFNAIKDSLERKDHE